jgi:hypothetical protein
MKTGKVLLCMMLSILFLFSCQKGGKKHQQDSEKDYYKQVEIQIKKMTDDNINLMIDNQKVYIGFDSLHTIELKYLRHKLFLYFSFQTCTPCIEQTVECIKKVFPEYETDEEIYLISPDYPQRFRAECYGKKLLSLENKKLGIPLESKNIPFIFTLSDSLTVENLHVVNKNDFKRTLHFLVKLKRRQ